MHSGASSESSQCLRSGGKQEARANEDAVLKCMRDNPSWSQTQIAESIGWVGEDGRPEKWRVQRAIASLADSKLVDQKRKGAVWTITPKGEEALKEAA